MDETVHIKNMALEEELSKQESEEEEDVGCYFLQPSSSPYNVTEKVQKANVDLQNSNLNSNKTAKVKFRDELVSFEPDLTDDDVNSIESDIPAEEIVHRGEPLSHIPEDETESESLRVAYAEAELEEEACDIFEEEELVSDTEDSDSPKPSDTTKMPDSPEKIVSETLRVDSCKTYRKPHRKAKSTVSGVNCREHCIEHIDSNLSMSIRKLEIHEKPPSNLPPLHLRQRPCCDDNKINRNLPRYNGCRSEYGLTSRQLQRRNRYAEMLKQKEIARQRLLEEYRRLKIEQNEQVFCQWLKDISRRKGHSRNASRASHTTQETTRSFDKDNTSKRLKERPKTAGVNEFIPKTRIKMKKRPLTTESCIYIQVPRDVLAKGIQIGDLLVTNAKAINKKLHILTVS
ncbi:uncharacterized protein LOC132702564 [Cylas formicarius]|uniref:uncharacterized protein LOC132702564 n=1 Tax=Cylas formicarius TaxID=197179 RepID=UPI0029588C02|nr:uncharacterized protein LOC132702564 [Cylas formicarius]